MKRVKDKQEKSSVDPVLQDVDQDVLLEAGVEGDQTIGNIVQVTRWIQIQISNIKASMYQNESFLFLDVILNNFSWNQKMTCQY